MGIIRNHFANTPINIAGREAIDSDAVVELDDADVWIAKALLLGCKLTHHQISVNDHTYRWSCGFSGHVSEYELDDFCVYDDFAGVVAKKAVQRITGG